MSIQRLRAVLLGAAFTAAPLGCGSAEPTYYALRPARDARPAAPANGWAHLVKLRRPAIAGYLDRAEIVSRISDYRLRVASGDSWSEPLAEMVGRVLAEDLGQRLPGSVIFTEMSPISADPDAVVSVDIQRFDASDDGTLTLRAEIAVERAKDHAPIATRNIDLHVRPPATSTPALVAGMSDLVAQLAEQIAPFLAAPPPT